MGFIASNNIVIVNKLICVVKCNITFYVSNRPFSVVLLINFTVTRFMEFTTFAHTKTFVYNIVIISGNISHS